MIKFDKKRVYYDEGITDFYTIPYDITGVFIILKDADPDNDMLIVETCINKYNIYHFRRPEKASLVETCRDCGQPFAETAIKIDENEEMTVKQCGCRENLNFYKDVSGRMYPAKTATIKTTEFIPLDHGLLVAEINKIFDDKIADIRNAADWDLLNGVRKEVNKAFQKAFRPIIRWQGVINTDE